jgi:alanine racemase
MGIQNSALTINQEKQLRRLKLESSRHDLRTRDTLLTHQQLAKAVAHYRRAQKLTTAEAGELRKEFLLEIDTCLERLGFK